VTGFSFRRSHPSSKHKMARRASSLIRRSFTQMDRAFWCLQDHPGILARLALPSLLGTGLLAAAISVTARTWDLEHLNVYLIYWVGFPTVILWAFTFLPLPCAVFVWFRARGESLSAAQCFAYFFRKSGRLIPVAFWVGMLYVFSFLLGGLPLLWLWPRCSLAPMVALFEKGRKVFGRARRLLKEEAAIHALAVIEVCVFVGLLATVFVPRAVLAAELFTTPTVQWIARSLWVFELMAGTVLVAGMAVSWCLSLTLLYHDIRYLREGELLRERIQELRESLRGMASPSV